MARLNNKMNCVANHSKSGGSQCSSYHNACYFNKMAKLIDLMGYFKWVANIFDGRQKLELGGNCFNLVSSIKSNIDYNALNYAQRSHVSCPFASNSYEPLSTSETISPCLKLITRLRIASTIS